MIKLIVNYEEKKYRMRVNLCTTVHILQIKIRKYLNITAEQAVFLFINGSLYSQGVLLSEIRGEAPLTVEVLHENTFGSWNRMFVRCAVKKVLSVYSVTITYSYYNVYNFCETSVFESLDLANAYILDQRCSGRISYTG